MDAHLASRTFKTDLLAGAGVAVAVALAMRTFAVPPVIVACIAAIVFIRVFASLRRLHTASPLRFQHFEPAPFEFEPASCLDEVAASIGIAADDRQRPAALPTVIEMQQSIQQRLDAVEAAEEPELEPSGQSDREEELRAAIRGLRRARG